MTDTKTNFSSDDFSRKAEAKAMRDELLSKFFTAALFLTATTAAAQEAKTTETTKQEPVSESPVTKTDAADKSQTTCVIGSGGIFALTSQKDGTAYYTDLTPNVTLTTTNKAGDYAKFSAMESLVLNDTEHSALTIKFMIELGKQLGDGSQIIFKAGRESTEAGSVYDTALSYYADTQNIATFGNLSNLTAIGFVKDGVYTEIGMIGSINDGIYVVPNPKAASFWAKGGVTLLERSGVKLCMDGATRLGNGHKDLLSSIGITAPGFKARAMGKYDFVGRSGALCADMTKDLKNGWKIMGGTVFQQGKEVRIHCGVDKNDVQFSVEFAKQKDQHSTVNFTIATHLARSKTMTR